MPRALALGAAVLVPLLCLPTAPTDADEPLHFGHVFDDAPLDVTTPRSGETFTEAVQTFHRTGENPYSADADAVAAGKPLYDRHCQACHMPDGRGRMGPSLIDDTYQYPRSATDKGFFEILYGGAAGAMQGFGRRVDQDDLLRIMAYVETLRRE
jgi:cytochrome c-L